VFGLSWTQIMVIVVIGVFLLGPERIPVAVQWLTSSLKKVRTMAQGAQDQLHSELGPEIAEMRRQISELQSLKEFKELRDLKELHPRNLIGKGLLGPDVSTQNGMAGILGIDKDFLKGPDEKTKPMSAGGPADMLPVEPSPAAAAEPSAVSMSKAESPAAADPLPTYSAPPAVDAVPAADPLPVLEPLPAADRVPSADPVPSADRVSTADPLPSSGRTSAADPLPRFQSPTAGSSPAFGSNGDPMPVSQPALGVQVDAERS